MQRINYCEIDLDAIRQNVRVMRAAIHGGAKLLAVVKADAYGHGAVPVARAALTAGAQMLAVAIPEEGIELRQAGIDAPILVLGGIDESAAEAVVAAGLTQVVSGLRVIAPLLTFPVMLHELTGQTEFDLIGLQITAFPLDHGIPCFGWRLHLPRRAAFDPEKARALQVPIPLWKTLQRGEAVKAEGRTIEPEDVMGPPRRGITVLYATDTRPVDAIPDLGFRCDLMILEGMYGAEEKYPLAIKNHHMLYREAAALARDAEASRLLLTHFSTSIEAPEEYLPNAQSIFPATDVASDGMTLTLQYP